MKYKDLKWILEQEVDFNSPYWAGKSWSEKEKFLKSVNYLKKVIKLAITNRVSN